MQQTSETKYKVFFPHSYTVLAFITMPNSPNPYSQWMTQFPLPEYLFIALCQAQSISAWEKSSVQEGVNAEYTAQTLIVNTSTSWIFALNYLQSFFRKWRDTSIFWGRFIPPETVTERNFILHVSEGNSAHILWWIAFGAAHVSLSPTEGYLVTNINWNC